MAIRSILVRDLHIGYRLVSDIKSEGKTLVTKGTVLTSSLIEKLKLWFEDSDACVYVEESDPKGNTNMSNCIDPQLEQKTIDEIGHLLEANLKTFNKSFEQVSACMEEVVSKVEPTVILGVDFTKFRTSGLHYRDNHSLRSAIFCICLAMLYNKTVPSFAEIDLVHIALAATIHDYGKRFQSSMSELSGLKPDKKLFKKLNLHPNLLDGPFILDLHTIYAYIALLRETDVPQDVCEIIMLSGLANDTMNEFDRNSPVVQAAKIVKFCHVYDKLLEYVIQNRLTTPMENVLAIISQAVESGDLSRATYEMCMQNIEIYVPGTHVLLSTGDTAEVIGNTLNFPTMPIVCIHNSNGEDNVLDLTKETSVTIKKIVFDTGTEEVNAFFNSQLGNFIDND